MMSLRSSSPSKTLHDPSDPYQPQIAEDLLKAQTE